jgi:hypothetical protein
VEDVRLAGNGWVGWEGDIGEDSSNSGTLRFRGWVVEWNGCVELWLDGIEPQHDGIEPQHDGIEPQHDGVVLWPGGQAAACWAQPAGGYGDGVGTGHTGGHWIIEDSVFRHNTQDGLDLLYASESDASVVIRRTVARDNAGDQIKTSGTTLVENVLAVSHCGYFQGKPFTYVDSRRGEAVDHCRAGGSALALNLRRGNHARLVNSTLAGQGDCLLIAECQGTHPCDGSESVRARNSIWIGDDQFGDPQDTTCLAWSGLAHNPFDYDHSIFDGVKGIPEPCPVYSLCGVAPRLLDKRIATLDAHLRAESPAIDAGTPEGAPPHDLEGHPRDAQPDIGALEWWNPDTWLFLPFVTRGA